MDRPPVETNVDCASAAPLALVAGRTVVEGMFGYEPDPWFYFDLAAPDDTLRIFLSNNDGADADGGFELTMDAGPSRADLTRVLDVSSAGDEQAVPVLAGRTYLRVDGRLSQTYYVEVAHTPPAL